MNQAMDSTIRCFEEMQSTSSHAVDTASISSARAELRRVTEAFDSMEDSVRRVNRQEEQTVSLTKSVLGAAKSLAVSFAGLAGLSKLVSLSDDVTSTTARLSLIVEDGGSVEALEEKIMASANRSRSAYLDTAAAVAKLGLNAGDAFSGNDELVQFAELLNKQFVIGGASAQEQSAAMLQLTQAMASGVLRGEELNSIFEQAPTIIQSIADYMGVSVGEIRTLASEGQITAEIVKNAMFSSADAINERFNSMPMTWSQVFTQAGNIALQALDPLLSGINWLANNIQIIGPLVLGLGSSFAVFLVAANWMKIATAATKAWTTAQLALDAAMNANPIGIIIGLVAALIGVIYAVVAAVNKFTGTSVSATGVICGAFYSMGAFIHNVIVDLINVVINLFVTAQNLVADFVNFVGGLLGSDGDVMKAWKAEDWMLERKSYRESYNKGYSVGETLFSGVSDTESAVNQSIAVPDYSSISTLDDISSNVADTATNTAETADALRYSNEELSLLRDIAERESINQFTTAEIRVDMTNHNTIGSDQDLDGILYKLETKLEESMQYVSEGAHL